MGKYAQMAKALAFEGHAGQFRFDGVTPYFTHLEGVASKFTDNDEMEAAAWLHDYLEDVLKCKTSEDIEKACIFLQAKGFTTAIIATVVYMTRLPDTDYDFYLSVIKMNPYAKAIKIIDILYNLGDSPSKKQVKKYAKALTYLLSP